jgi:hypothetical protein
MRVNDINMYAAQTKTTWPFLVFITNNGEIKYKNNNIVINQRVGGAGFKNIETAIAALKEVNMSDMPKMKKIISATKYKG